MNLANSANQKKYIDRVHDFLNDKLLVKNNFDSIDISKGINWDYKHSHNANTYQIYIHSLGIVKDLVQYVRTVENNPQYLLKAREVIKNWFEYNDYERDNKAWHEHSVAARITNIIYFQERAGEFKLSEDTFDAILDKHCEYLFSERHYKQNNHGLMMDRALINSVKYLKDEERKRTYLDKVVYRVKYALYRDFSRKGVHLENSPEYHRMVLQIFKDINKALAKVKINLGKEAEAILKRVEIYQRYLVKPNHHYPMIGDTGTYYDYNIKKHYNDFIDHEAGIGILQYKNVNDTSKSTWLSFKSGYLSKTHKHKDDLSINLFMNGYDVFIDSGKYSYKTSDPIRKYLVSPEAHNTIYIEGKDYELNNPIDDQFGLKINRYVERSNYKTITGVNKLYRDSVLSRHTILTKDNHVFLVDNILNKKEESVNQVFNINEDATINKLTELKYEIIIEKDIYILEVFPRPNSNVTSSIKKGYISRQFSKYHNNSRIIFNQKGKRIKFITAFYPKNDESHLNSVGLEGGRLSYNYQGKNHLISL